MRLSEIIRESAIYGHMKSRYAAADAPETVVYRLQSRQHLLALLAKHRYLRGISEDGMVLVWNGEEAAHGTYENTFGHGGWRIEFNGDGERVGLGYNTYDCNKTELRRDLTLRRLLTPEEIKAAWSYE